MNRHEIVAGALCGFIGILIGSFWLSGSTKWLFNLISSVGSIATAGSFIYIILDNRKIRQAQENETNERKKEEKKQRQELNKEKERREAHELKQQQLWKEQMEMAAFEKYQRHQVMFDSLLDTLELKHNHLFRFVDRIGLYGQLFPRNTPQYCEYYIERVSDSFQEELQMASKENIYEAITAPKPTLAPAEYISSISALKNKLKIIFQGKLDIGGFSHLAHESTDINLFDPLLTSQIITDIINRLVTFSTGMPEQDELTFINLNYKFVGTITDWIVEQHSWAGELKHHPHNSALLCSYLHLNNLSKVYRHHTDSERKHFLQLETLFESVNNVEAFIGTIDSPEAYIERCIQELDTLNNTQTETEFKDSIYAYKQLLKN